MGGVNGSVLSLRCFGVVVDVSSCLQGERSFLIVSFVVGYKGGD
jgi:hypothetical protein